MYNPNIPQPNDLLSTSQGNILNNFGALNSVYGVDHYAYDDTSQNATFHKKVTTPPLNAHPDATNNSILYSYQDIASIGPIQYSKGKTRGDQGNQVSTPLTAIQSNNVSPIVLNKGSPNPLNGQTSNVLDFNGITRAFAVLTTGNFSSSSSGLYVNSATIVYSNTASAFKIQMLDQSGNPNIIIVSSGTILQIKNATGNNLNNVYWTLQFLRIEI